MKLRNDEERPNVIKKVRIVSGLNNVFESVMVEILVYNSV